MPTMTSRPTISREWRLIRRPRGAFVASDLDLVETQVPSPRPGEVVVANTHLSVDPYMRGRMDDAPSYIPPFPLGSALDGGAVGIVVESRSTALAQGDVVEHFLGMREAVVADAGAFVPLDLAGRAPEVYLGTLGATGLTAWLATSAMAPIRDGDTVVVTGAAGAVGGLAGQLARLRGAGRVIGSAGSATKRALLIEELGYDDAFDYHDGSAEELLAKAAPGGIDVLVDSVGGAQLEAAIDQMATGGRIALVGMASEYDGRTPHPFTNLYSLVRRRVSVQGFLVSDHLDRLAEFRREVGAWLDEGAVLHRETVVLGIEALPDTLHAVLSSGSTLTGKAVLSLA